MRESIEISRRIGFLSFNEVGEVNARVNEDRIIEQYPVGNSIRPLTNWVLISREVRRGRPRRRSSRIYERQ